MLVRMAAGTTYPSHRHAGDEQCFVLDGDLHVGEIVLHSGDFQLAPEESEHGPQSTVGGCTLLIVSSRNDELLPTS
jgi:anti-sigma factor ChrR (cupin superfamily)